MNLSNQPPSKLDLDFKEATRLHQSGAFSAARKQYETIIAYAPQHADSYHLLSLLLVEEDIEKALTLISQAIHLRSNFAPYYLNRALMFERLREYPRAIADYLQALNLNPDPTTYARLGQAYLSASQFYQAEETLQKVLRVEPENITALNNLGTVYFHLENYPASISYYEKALRLNPHHPDILSNLGALYAELHNTEAATDCYEKALQIDAHHPKALTNFAMLCSQHHDYDKAERLYQNALNLTPNDAALHNSVGLHYKNQNKLSQAYPYFAKAQQLLSPFQEAEFNEALTLLAQGDFHLGFQKYEARFQLKERKGELEQSHQPLWAGETATDKVLLVRVEQGFGDTIQFVRYLPQVKERFQGKVVFECQAELIALFKTQPLGFDDIVPRTPRLPTHDYVTYLMSLPRLFHTTLTSIPYSEGYLTVAASTSFPTTDGKPKIGLVWAGGALHKNNPNRSLALERFLPLLNHQAVDFYSFQHGEPKEALHRLGLTHMIDVTPAQKTFLDTAADVKHLDLLITVDTAMAHLGGALGVPTLVLLPYAPDFRWLLARQDSPWYDSVRLLRQNTPGDWTETLHHLTTHLASYVNHSEGAHRLKTTPIPTKPASDPLTTKAEGRNTVSFEERLQQAAQLGRAGDWVAAKQACEAALNLMPHHPRAEELLGMIALQNNTPYVAEAHLLNAQKTGYRTPELFHHLGVAYALTQRFPQAFGCFQEALEMEPTFEAAKQALLKGLMMAGVDEHQRRYLTSAEKKYLRILEMMPHSVEVLNNLGALYLELNALERAAHHFEAALRHQPDYLPALKNLSDLYLRVEQFDNAILQFEKALRLAPEDRSLLQNYTQTLLRSGAWADLDTVKHRLYQNVIDALKQDKPTGISPFIAILLNFDEQTHYQIATQHARETFGKIQRLPATPALQPNKVLNIGYVSPDFRDHATGHLVVGMMEQHDKTKCTIFTYHIGDHTPENSSYRQRIQKATRWTDISHLPALEAAKKIQTDNIDILIDLRTYTHNSRTEIFAYRPAPIQISYIGFPGTTGCDFFDYFIADPTTLPETSQRYFSEAILYLPYTYFPTDNKMFIPKSIPQKSQYGLPENTFVFCSFCSQHKVEPEIFSTWMDILKQTDNSVLWLISQDHHRSLRLKDEAERQGVNPNRIIFSNHVPKDEHLTRYALADISLDTFIYNGHTTTIDALWANVPVICLLGDTLATRVSAAMCKAVGHPEWIATTKEDYLEKAVYYAKHPEMLARLKETLAQDKLNTPLFDTQRFTRTLEQGVRHLWQVACRRETPRHYYVPWEK